MLTSAKSSQSCLRYPIRTNLNRPSKFHNALFDNDIMIRHGSNPLASAHVDLTSVLFNVE
jgi:hypothetical protein